jgi:hypothetical protein
MAKGKRFAVGDEVRLTGAFLKSTGQQTGVEGRLTWIVQACPCRLCADGRFVLTDQPREDDGMFTAEEIAREPHLQYRHINAGNLVRVGVPDGSVDR